MAGRIRKMFPHLRRECNVAPFIDRQLGLANANWDSNQEDERHQAVCDLPWKLPAIRPVNRLRFALQRIALTTRLISSCVKGNASWLSR